MSAYVTRDELAAMLRDLAAAICAEPTNMGFQPNENEGETINPDDSARPDDTIDFPDLKNSRVALGVAKRMHRIVTDRASTVEEISALAVSRVDETSAVRRFLASYVDDIQDAAFRGRRIVNSPKKARASGWVETDIAMLYLILLAFGQVDDGDIKSVIKPRRPGMKFQREHMPAVFARALDELGVTDEYICEVVEYFGQELP